MATTMYFEETVVDQDERASLEIEFGRSSFYSQCDVKSGEGEDSIYIVVDDKRVIMTKDMAKKFVQAAESVGLYFGLLDS